MRGSNGSIGPVRATPKRLAEPSPLVDGDDYTVGRAHREQVHRGGLERDGDRPEHRHKEQERQQDDQADHPWQPGRR